LCKPLRVVLLDPLLVGSRADVVDPVEMSEKPLDGAADSAFKLLRGAPVQFALDLCGVDGIATVVARAILDIRDQAGTLAEGRIRDHFIENFADCGHDFNVGTLVVASN